MRLCADPQTNVACLAHPIIERGTLMKQFAFITTAALSLVFGVGGGYAQQDQPRGRQDQEQQQKEDRRRPERAGNPRQPNRPEERRPADQNRQERTRQQEVERNSRQQERAREQQQQIEQQRSREAQRGRQDQLNSRSRKPPARPGWSGTTSQRNRPWGHTRR